MWTSTSTESVQAHTPSFGELKRLWRLPHRQPGTNDELRLSKISRRGVCSFSVRVRVRLCVSNPPVKQTRLDNDDSHTGDCANEKRIQHVCTPYSTCTFLSIKSHPKTALMPKLAPWPSWGNKTRHPQIRTCVVVPTLKLPRCST